jgi:hypothetical protein
VARKPLHRTGDPVSRELELRPMSRTHLGVGRRCYSRAAMEAVAWTAIGLLGAAVLGSFGSFFYLGTRIDALGARLDSRIDAQRDRIDAQSERIDAQSDRIDAQGARIDAQYASIQAQGRDLMSAIQAQGRDLVGAIQAHGLELGSRIDALAARMDDHLGRHAS